MDPQGIEMRLIYPRRMSYPSIQAIARNITYKKRKQLARNHRDFRSGASFLITDLEIRYSSQEVSIAIDGMRWRFSEHPESEQLLLGCNPELKIKCVSRDNDFYNLVVEHCLGGRRPHRVVNFSVFNVPSWRTPVTNVVITNLLISCLQVGSIERCMKGFRELSIEKLTVKTDTDEPFWDQELMHFHTSATIIYSKIPTQFFYFKVLMSPVLIVEEGASQKLRFFEMADKLINDDHAIRSYYTCCLEDDELEGVWCQMRIRFQPRWWTDEFMVIELDKTKKEVYVTRHKTADANVEKWKVAIIRKGCDWEQKLIEPPPKLCPCLDSPYGKAGCSIPAVALLTTTITAFFSIRPTREDTMKDSVFLFTFQIVFAYLAFILFFLIQTLRIETDSRCYKVVRWLFLSLIAFLTLLAFSPIVFFFLFRYWFCSWNPGCGEHEYLFEPFQEVYFAFFLGT